MTVHDLPGGGDLAVPFHVTLSPREFQERGPPGAKQLTFKQVVQGSAPTAALRIERWLAGDFAFVPEKSSFLDCWDVATILALISTATLLPFETALMMEQPVGLDRTNRLLDCVFCLDILINFNIAVPRQDALTVHTFEKRPVKIAERYTSVPFSEGGEAGWFWFDCITVVPWDVVPSLLRANGILNMQHLRLARVMRLVRMFRLLRVIKLCNRWHSVLGASYGLLSFMQCLGFVLILLHWLACIWAYLAMPGGQHAHHTNWLHARAALMKRDHLDFTQWEVYSLALNFCASTLTSVGLGDIRPASDLEVLVATLMMIVTGFVWACIVPNIVDIVMNLDTYTSKFNDLMDELNRIFTTRAMKNSMRWRVRRYMHEASMVHRQTHQLKTVQWLSVGLRGEVAMESGMKDVAEMVWYLKGISRQVLVDISLCFLPQMFAPGEWVLDHASVRVIRAGICVSKGTRFYTRGDVLGDDCLLEQEYLRDSACPRTLTYLECMALHRDDIFKLCANHQELAKAIRKAQIKLVVWRGVVYAAHQSKVPGSKWEQLWQSYHKDKEGGLFEHGVSHRAKRRAILMHLRNISCSMAALEDRMAGLADCPSWAQVCEAPSCEVTRC